MTDSTRVILTLEHRILYSDSVNVYSLVTKQKRRALLLQCLDLTKKFLEKLYFRSLFPKFLSFSEYDTHLQILKKSVITRHELLHNYVR